MSGSTAGSAARERRRRGLVSTPILAGVGAALCAGVGGCVANSSNPVVVAHEVTSDATATTFALEVVNPGGRLLILEEVRAQVSTGETDFPAGAGVWNGSLELPPGGHGMLSLRTVLDTPSPEASDLFHLNGELKFSDKTGFLGIDSLDLTRTSFRLDVKAGHEK